MTAQPPRPEHQNNIGVLRLVLSILVLFSHCYPLTQGTNDNEPLVLASSQQATFGLIAVDGFFLLSGYLVTVSWRRSKTAGEFLAKRLLRIYPGYLVALIFSLVIGVISSWPTPLFYIRLILYSNDQFLKALLLVQAGSVDQEVAFRTNPLPGVVNGSLWTLQPELLCYLIVLGLGIFGLINRRFFVIALFAVSFLMYATNRLQLPTQDHNFKFSRFLMFFMLGSICTMIRLRSNLAPIFVTVVLLVLSMQSRIAFPLLYPIAYAYLIFGVAFLPFAPGANFLSRYDLSYGVYLYAFPVQQMVVWLLELRSPFLLFGIALPFTLFLAYFSWRFVEAPMIAYRKRILL